MQNNIRSTTANAAPPPPLAASPADVVAWVWENLRVHARDIAAAEPVLSPMLCELVLDQPALSAAIAACVNSKLAVAGVRLGPPLEEVVKEAFAADATIVQKTCHDLLAVVQRDPACDTLLTPFLWFKGFHAITCHRVAHWLWGKGRVHLARCIQSTVSDVMAVDIHPAARLGKGILLDHATGFVVGETAVIEDDVSILHAVTLGGTGKESGDRHPKVRRGVLIGAGAKILGNIEIGEGARIAAGSVVLDPVPPHTTVAGIPAVVVGETARDETPAFNMNHNNINHPPHDVTRT